MALYCFARAEEQHHAQWSEHPRAINFAISQARMHSLAGQQVGPYTRPGYRMDGQTYLYFSVPGYSRSSSVDIGI